MRELIAGPNFSGRSEHLRAWLTAREGKSFFIGPYAEAALSGLSNSVADEVGVYRARNPPHRSPFDGLDIATFIDRKPATLSGGEQVLLALTCFSHSAYTGIGIDTALEQLDHDNRAAALAYLGGGDPFDVALIDNRIDHLEGWSQLAAHDSGTDFGCDPTALTRNLPRRLAPAFRMRGLEFGYGSGDPIFRDLDLELAPGAVYRLIGPNGAGKTTFFKLLVGVLAPRHGTLFLDEVTYQPRRHGNRAIALATQNPDHQWCGATLLEDMTRRRRACGNDRFPTNETIAALSLQLGLPSLDHHLYELPLTARKRVSWLWPFCGAMPWLMLDEPTIGQDEGTRATLGAAIARICALGYGAIVVTHDDDFAAQIPHRALRIEDKTIRMT